MLETAWEHLVREGSLSNKHLLAGTGLNVKRSSAVCAILARLPGVEVASSTPIVLRYRAQHADVIERAFKLAREAHGGQRPERGRAFRTSRISCRRQPSCGSTVAATSTPPRPCSTITSRTRGRRWRRAAADGVRRRSADRRDRRGCRTRCRAPARRRRLGRHGRWHISDTSPSSRHTCCSSRRPTSCTTPGRRWRLPRLEELSAAVQPRPRISALVLRGAGTGVLSSAAGTARR